MGIPPLQKAALAREYRVAAWLSQVIASLSKASCSVSVEAMAVTLGWETAARILAIRDTASKEKEPSLVKEAAVMPSAITTSQLPDHDGTLSRTPSVAGARVTIAPTLKQNGCEAPLAIKKASGHRGANGIVSDTDILGVVRKHFGAEIRRLKY